MTDLAIPSALDTGYDRYAPRPGQHVTVLLRGSIVATMLVLPRDPATGSLRGRFEARAPIEGEMLSLAWADDSAHLSVPAEVVAWANERVAHLRITGGATRRQRRRNDRVPLRVPVLIVHPHALSTAVMSIDMSQHGIGIEHSAGHASVGQRLGMVVTLPDGVVCVTGEVASVRAATVGITFTHVTDDDRERLAAAARAAGRRHGHLP